MLASCQHDDLANREVESLSYTKIGQVELVPEHAALATARSDPLAVSQARGLICVADGAGTVSPHAA